MRDRLGSHDGDLSGQLSRHADKLASQSAVIISDGNALGFFIALFQLLFLKPFDFLVLAFGDGCQR